MKTALLLRPQIFFVFMTLSVVLVSFLDWIWMYGLPSSSATIKVLKSEIYCSLKCLVFWFLWTTPRTKHFLCSSVKGEYTLLTTREAWSTSEHANQLQRDLPKKQRVSSLLAQSSEAIFTGFNKILILKPLPPKYFKLSRVKLILYIKQWYWDEWVDNEFTKKNRSTKKPQKSR